MEINDSEHLELIKKATEKTVILRGAFIQHFAMMEIMLDGFLASHFCITLRERRDFLTLLMTSKIITFESKRKLFNKIAILYYPDFIKSNEGFYGLMDKIRDVRNDFAHSQLDVSITGMQRFKETGNFYILDSSKQSKEYKVEDIYSLGEKVKRLGEAIAEHTYK